MIARSWLPPDALNTRVVFYSYAVLAGLAGILLIIWGPLWLDENPIDLGADRIALIRLFGAVLVAAACFAVGFARVEDPPSRHRALLWFAVGHFAVWLVVDYYSWSTPFGDLIENLLLFACLVLSLLWTTAAGQSLEPPDFFTTLFNRPSPTTTERVHPAYEQQIRQAARQEERNRLGRDLHDSIKQQIFAIQTSAATVQVRFDTDRAGASDALQQIRNSAREATTEMEVMLDQLQSAPLENTGLVEGLKRQCEALGFRTGAKVEFKAGELPSSASFVPGAQEAIFRAAQEALSNVARHARADHVLVKLEGLGDQLVLTVWDNGSGFDPNKARNGMGIRNMRKRAEEFDGSLELETSPGAGTSIRLSLPCAVGKAESYRWQTIVLATAAGAHVILAAWTGMLPLIALGALSAVFAARSAYAWRRLRRSEATP